MVRNASRTLKIGVHSPFDPNFDVGGGTFYPQKFRQAYCIAFTSNICEVLESLLESQVHLIHLRQKFGLLLFINANQPNSDYLVESLLYSVMKGCNYTTNKSEVTAAVCVKS